MMTVLDASALLAFAYGEPGSDREAEVMGTSAISAVNAAEVVSKLRDRHTPPELVERLWRVIVGMVQDFTPEQAKVAGNMRRATRSLGLSLGDRACLALAEALGAKVLTADRAWSELSIGLEIEVIR